MKAEILKNKVNFYSGEDLIYMSVFGGFNAGSLVLSYDLVDVFGNAINVELVSTPDGSFE